MHATPLGFKGMTIVAHPSQPWLYISGAAAAPGGPNAAVVRLGADGLPESVDACTLDNGYCWLSVDRTARFLLGCDYGTGKVDIFPLDAAGKPGRRCGGADQGRKEGHCAQPTPDNKFVYMPHVKGSNALFQYAFDAATGSIAPLDPVDVGPPEGSGPRHVAYHPDLPLAYFSEERSTRPMNVTSLVPYRPRTVFGRASANVTPAIRFNRSIRTGSMPIASTASGRPSASSGTDVALKPNAIRAS